MAPYVTYNTGQQEWEEKSRDLAIASGMTIVWKVKTAFNDEKFPGSSSVEMGRANIPSIVLEAGGRGV